MNRRGLPFEARVARAWSPYPPAAIGHAHRSLCRRGIPNGTNEMNNCVGQKQQVLMNFMNNMQRQQQANYQQQMQFYQRPVYQNPVYQNPTINCSSNRMGNFVSTTCN
jgi:hypothetical protein